jgi:cytochrome c oxidase assembly protein subunit 15
LTSYRNLHRFALGTAVCTFLLIVAGGLVTSTGSGLSVPDWPNTYGRFMFAFPLDQMVGGIVFEHTHRLIASAVGFLTVLLAIWLWKREDRRWVRILGVAAVGLVVAQGLLGGLTVLLLLPPALSVGHAMLAQTFFVVVASLALFTSPWWRSAQPRPPARSRSIVWLAGSATAAVFIQLMLGALMRHTDSGLAIPDFPLAYGQLLPSLSADALARYNATLLDLGIRIAADGPISSSQVLIHLVHRIWAVPVFLLVLWTSVRLVRLAPVSGRFSRFGWILGALVAVQILLGAMTVLSGKAVLPATAHVATGALLLVGLALATLHGARVWGLPRLGILHSASAQSAYGGAS